MKLLIGVPTMEGIVDVDTFTGIYNLIIPKEIRYKELNFARGYGVAQARNKIVRTALLDNFDYILFVDSDIILPRDALEKMLAQNTDIVTGWYTDITRCKKMMHPWVIYNKETNKYCYNPKEYNNLEKDAIVELDACGFGCVLIKTGIFKRLEYPYFVYMEYAPYYDVGENMYFCGVIRENLPDVRIRGVRSVECGHIKRKLVE